MVKKKGIKGAASLSVLRRSWTSGTILMSNSRSGRTLISGGGYLLLAGEDPFFNESGDEFYAGEDIDNSLFFDISLSTSSDAIQLLDANGNEVDLVDGDVSDLLLVLLSVT